MNDLVKIIRVNATKRPASAPVLSETEKEALRQNKERVRALRVKIGVQFNSNDNPHVALMQTIVDQTISDALVGSTEGRKHEALRYLRGKMVHAELAGVDPDWISRQIKLAGYSLIPAKTERTA